MKKTFYENSEQLLKNIIFSTIKPEDKIQVFLFGSRASNTARSRSDIDIALFAQKPLPIGLLSQLKEKIEESTIPYQVDLVDLATTSPEFRQKVISRGKLWTV